MAIVSGLVTHSYIYHAEEVAEFLGLKMEEITERHWRVISDKLAFYMTGSAPRNGSKWTVAMVADYFTAAPEVVKAAVLEAYKNVR
jgi:hypothetical protein